MLAEKWLEGPERRREFLEPLRELIEGPALALEDEWARRAAGPAMSVLHQGMDGIDLTATGAFSVDFTRRMAREHPCWAYGAAPDLLSREADLPMLRDLRAILEDCGFLRGEGRAAFTTENGAEILEQTPTGLLMALGCEIVWDQGFASQAAELCAAAVLAGEALEPVALADRIHPILAEFCRSGEDGLEIEATQLAVALWLELTSSVGVIPDAYLEDLRSAGSGDWPQPAGDLARACMVAVLRFRVLRATVLPW